MSVSNPSVDLSESRQGSLYAADAVTYVLAVLAVGLRFWSRRLKRAPCWIDDWFVLGALVVGTALLVNFCWWIPRGYGRHREYFGPSVDYYFFLGFFIAEITYTLIIVLVKFSILALYWRLFSSTSIRKPIWILVAIVTCWGLATFFLTIFTCVPPKAFWDKTVDASCNVNSQQFLFGISIPNILTDVALLLLPIPYVLKLNTRMSQKRLLIGTFLLGGFVCIASILRLVSVVKQKPDPDFSWNWVDQGIWAVIESNFAIISACLPTLRPVWTRIFKQTPQSTQDSRATPNIWSSRSNLFSKRSQAQEEQDFKHDSPGSLHVFRVIDETDENFKATS